MIGRNAKYIVATAVLLIGVFLLWGQFNSIPVNEWTASADMTTSRAAACSVRLPDGRVLVAGGDTDSGALATAEVYSGDGTFTVASPMAHPRANAACVAMADGRVLVTGGRNGMQAIASAEVYDPAADAWQDAGSMAMARTGHTATLSPWGAVLILGGEDSGTLEAYTTNGEFRTLGRLATPRNNYALAMMPNHKMLIFGGAEGDTAISTVEMFNADDNSIRMAGSMATARRNFGATPLYDGTVLLTGGIDKQGKILNTSEIFDPATGESAAGPALSVARANHQSILLHNNGSVMLVGGNDDKGELGSSELFTPWTGRFSATPKLHAARTSMAASLLKRGGLVVAGGKVAGNYLSGAEQYRFSTIEPGKLDYMPGEVASFTGAGWKAGEQVLIEVQAFPIDQHKVEFTSVAVADSTGQIKFGGFNIDRSHAGARFLMTATGSASKAQTLFTDAADTTNTSLTATPGSGTYAVTAPTFSGVVTDSNNGAASPTGTVNVVNDGVVIASPVLAAIAGGGASYSAPLGATAITPGTHSIQAFYLGDGGVTFGASNSSAITYVVSNTVAVAVTAPGNGSTAVVGSGTTFTATVVGAGAPPPPAIGTGTVTFTITGGPAGFVPVILGPISVVGGSATFANYSSLPGCNAACGGFNVTATYTPQSGNGYPAFTSLANNFFRTPATPLVTFTPTPNAPTFGQLVTFNVVVTGITGIVPVGNISVRDNSSSISNAVPLDAGGKASFSTNTLTAAPAGHPIDVTFSSANQNYANQASVVQTIHIGQASATTGVVTSPVSPVSFGQGVTLTGTITSTGAIAAGYNINGVGLATFYLDGLAIPNANCVSGNPAAVLANTASCQLPANSPSLTPGDHTVQMTFAGDINVASVNLAGAPTTSLHVNSAGSTLSVSAPAGSSPLGTSVTYTATVTVSPASGYPAVPGTVAFFDNGTAVGTCALQPLSAGIGGVGTATCTETYDGSANLQAGNHSITAVWAGVPPSVAGSNNNSSPFNKTIDKAIITFTGLPTLTVASPIPYGTADTVQQVVAAKQLGVAASPTSSFGVFDGASQIGTVPVNFAATDSLALPTSVINLAGTHSLTFVYPSGGSPADPNFAPATSGAVVLSVNQATPTVTYIGGTLPPFSTTYGGTLPTFQVQVSPVGSGAVPTGTVTLLSGATQIGSPVALSACAGPAACATFTNALLPNNINVGAGQNLTVRYNGDTNYTVASNSGANLTVTAAPVTITVTSTSIPPAAPGNPLYSQSVTFTATIVGAGAPATGNVSFVNEGSQVVGGCSNVAVNPSGANGVATCTFTAVDANNLGVGLHSVKVGSFTGDANHSATIPGGSIVPTVNFNVLPDPTTTTLVSTPNPSTPSQAITLTATVTIPAGLTGPLNGKVNFTTGVTSLCSAVALNGTSSGSTATCVVPANTAPFTVAGPYIITATYSDPAVNAQTAGSIGNLTHTVSKPIPIITISSNLNPSAYGQAVTLTAVVTVPAGGPLPTGVLQFYDGGSTLGGTLAIVSSGANSVTYTLTVPSGAIPTFSGGTHAITATYIPNLDPNYGQGNSQSQVPPVVLQQVVTKADCNIGNYQIIATPSTIVFGETITISVDVTPIGSNAGTPTGQVIFFDASNQIGNPVTLQNVGGVQRASLTFNTLSTGTHNAINARYLGDTNFNPNTLPNQTITVNPDPTKTVLNTGTWPASPAFGGQITLSATACGLAPGSTTSCASSLPVGLSSTISFFDGSTLLGTSGPVDGSGQASITIIMENPPFALVGGGVIPGNHSITARYNGNGAPIGNDPNFVQSTSTPPQTLTIGKGNTTVSVQSNPNPTIYGQTVTLKATVLAPSSNAALPSGSATFFDGGVQIGLVTLTNVSGVMTAVLTAGPAGPAQVLGVGQHVISVTYSGDGNYNTSSTPLSGPGALVHTVNKAPTTTSISSSSNASNVGQQITLTAVVAVPDPGAGVPTGSVQFINTNAPIQPTVLGTSPVVVTAVPGVGNLNVATLVLATLPQGNPQIIARYSGDTNFLGSDSSVLTQSVNKTPTNIVFTSSLNPSIFGNQVTFAVTVVPVPPGTGTPTGQITIFDGTANLGNFTLQGGVFNYTTSSLTPGLHAIGVQYNGDTNFQPFTAPVIQQNVSKIPTSLNLTSNAFTAIASQVITLTAVLNPNAVPGVPFASGQVGFYDGATLIGISNLQSNVATLNVSNLSVGLHQLQAIYSGDGSWTGSTSGFFAQTITLASTSVQIVSSANPSVFGQPVTFTITVAVPFPGTVPASGQVQISDNHNNIGDPISANNGTFSITFSNFTPGIHNIVATFLGNSSFASSQSATLPQVVNKAGTVTTLAVAPNGSTSNQTVLMTAVVGVTSPGAGIPTGSVEFVNTTTQTSLGTVPLKSLGGLLVATLTTNALNQSGSPQILTATYSGDGNFATSTSNPQGIAVFGSSVTAVNGASQTVGNYAPDMWVTLYGDNLADTQLVASQIPYPTSLGGTTVSITDSNGTVRLCPLYFVSPKQINLLIPTNTAFGLATMTVTNPEGATSSTIVLITRTAPGLFTANQGGTGTAAALVQRVKSDGSQSIEQVVTFDSSGKPVASPITVGTDSLYLQFYGTGIRYNPGLSSVKCTINGQSAQVLYASAAPGFQGLDQVNVKLPDNFTGKGTVNVVITVDGQAANTVTLLFN